MLHDLVVDGRATLIGSIRQDLLGRIKNQAQFLTLCNNNMAAFEDMVLSPKDHECAVEYLNTAAAGVSKAATQIFCFPRSAHTQPTDFDD